MAAFRRRRVVEGAFLHGADLTLHRRLRGVRGRRLQGPVPPGRRGPPSRTVEAKTAPSTCGDRTS